MFTKTFLKDLLERAVKTFIAAFIVTVSAGLASVKDLSTAKALVFAAIAAGVSAVFSLVSLPVGGTVSPASAVKPAKDAR